MRPKALLFRESLKIFLRYSHLAIHPTNYFAVLFFFFFFVLWQEMQWGEMDWSPLGDGHHHRRRIKRWSTAFFGRTDTRWLYHSRRKFAFFSRQRQYGSQPHKPAINKRMPHTFVIGLLMPKYYQFFVVRLSIICFLSTRFTVDGFLSPTAAAYDQPQQQQRQQYAHKSFNNSSPPLCPNCLIRRDELRKYTLEEIKLQLLIKLGFTNGTPPNITASKLQTNEEAVVKQLMSNHGAFSTHRNRHKDDTQRIYNEEDDDRLKTTFLAIMGKPCMYYNILSFIVGR